LLEQARANLAMAEASVGVSKAAADAALMNFRAAKKSTKAVQSQMLSVEAGKQNATRQASRIFALSQAGATSEAKLDAAQTQVKNLGHQIEGLKANMQATQQRAYAAKGQVRLTESQILVSLSQTSLARASIKRAFSMVAECVLKAPMDGVVQLRNYEPGEAVLPGAKILSLVNLSELRATFFLPNAELAAAAPGKSVTVKADAYPKEEFKGTLLHVASKAEFTPRNIQTREDRDRLVYAVEISIPNRSGKLRPGMPVEVFIDGTGEKD
jgi:HlyD family secretion protein